MYVHIYQHVLMKDIKNNGEIIITDELLRNMYDLTELKYYEA